MIHPPSLSLLLHSASGSNTEGHFEVVYELLKHDMSNFVIASSELVGILMEREHKNGLTGITRDLLRNLKVDEDFSTGLYCQEVYD